MLRAVMEVPSSETVPGASSSSSNLQRAPRVRPAKRPPRRQSDSTLTDKDRDFDQDERAKLRIWAEEAMSAPPPLLQPCDENEPEESLKPAHMLRRNGSHGKTASRKAAATLEEEVASESSRRRSLCHPMSPMAESSTSTNVTSLPRLSSPRRKHSSSAGGSFDALLPDASLIWAEASKNLAQRRMESGQLDSDMLSRVQSVRIDQSNNRGRKNALLAASPALSSQTPTRQSLLAGTMDAQATPRPRLQTSSQYESEEEGLVETPVDMPTPSEMPAVSHQRQRLSQLAIMTSTDAMAPPALEAHALDSAEQAAIRRGLEAFARPDASAPIQTVMASRRRGSHSFDASRSLAPKPLLGPVVPTFSRDSLAQIGYVQGITPPPRSEAPTAISSGSSSAIVTTGLELGIMGFAPPIQAVSALSNDHGIYDEGGYTNTALAPKTHAHSTSQSEQHHDLSTHESMESDLWRRRTTTGAPVRDWKMSTPVKTRSATHDEAYTQSSAMASELPAKAVGSAAVVSFAPHQPVSSESFFHSAADNRSTPSSVDSRSTHYRVPQTPSTQLDTPSLSSRAMPSPDVNVHMGPFGSHAGHGPAEDDRVRKAKQRMLQDEAKGGQASWGSNGGLMGSNVGGHFGPGVRSKIIEVLDHIIAGIPMTGAEGETINLAEYGCLNSRSIPLMQLIISKISNRSHSRDASLASVAEEEEELAGSHISPSDVRVSLTSRVNFVVTHEDSTLADFRPVMQSLDTRSDSYLDASWQANHHPSMQNCIFPSFVGRPFASRIAPPSTMHFGLSLMDLHWNHTPVDSSIPTATSSQAELASFLRARAHEFKSGGILMVAFLARSDEAKSGFRGLSKLTKHAASQSQSMDTSSVTSFQESLRRQSSCSLPGRPGSADAHKKSSDIWTTLTNTLAPCIQRLVSCGMLKSDVARHLLELPLHPRTPRETRSVLTSLRHLWAVEWSCGLGGEEESAKTPPRAPGSSSNASEEGRRRSSSSLAARIPSEPLPLRIAHPAWKAYQAGTLSRVALAEHMVMLLKNLYEGHFRAVLREKGKLSKGAAEFVLDSLWDVLSSRIDDSEAGEAMELIEIEVTICALRKL